MSTSRTREKADGELFKSTGIDDNATSTAVTIDASENVLVGKTATAFGTAGTVLRGDNAGLLQSTRAGVSLELNRISSDGNIIDLAKDGTTVGSIGSSSGKLKVSSVNTGLIFGDAFDEIYPLTNGVTTLGDAGAKFKDLYLSGGVYLGGTGAANKLDDYEEGTWNPTEDGGWGSLTLSGTGSYTKIGNIVHLMALVNVDGSGVGSGDITMIGLPFTSSGTAGYRPAISIFVYDCAVDISTYISGLVQNNSTKVYIREGGLAGGGSDLGEHFNSNSQFYFQATYRVA